VDPKRLACSTPQGRTILQLGLGLAQLAGPGRNEVGKHHQDIITIIVTVTVVVVIFVEM
jgi:hypothetical protein